MKQVVRRWAGSARFWALTMTLAALVVMFTPRPASAYCSYYPCQSWQCVGPSGGCYPVGESICSNHAYLHCIYQNECATWSYAGWCP
jgi:hypothetical protein